MKAIETVVPTKETNRIVAVNFTYQPELSSKTSKKVIIVKVITKEIALIICNQLKNWLFHLYKI